MINQNLSDKIKQRRKELKMSQEELAALAGYTDRSIISKIEKGIVDLTESKIMSIAKALRTSPEFLVGWKNEGTKISICEEKEEYQLTPSELAEFEKLKNMQTSLFLFNDKQLSADAMEKFEQALLEAFIDTIKQRKGDTNK